MGHNTRQALEAFAPLADLATAASSLTIFGTDAVCMSKSIHRASDMLRLTLPGQ